MTDDDNSFKPPPLLPGVEEMLARQRRRRDIEDLIREEVGDLASSILKTHPLQADLLANILEAEAQRIRAAIEETKRKERNGARK